jgi:hypothetical protein
VNSPALLTAFEPCNRKGIWSRDWERIKIDLNELLQAGLREGLTTTRKDFGQAAGEKIIAIAAAREIVSDQYDVYSQVIHHAAIADIVTMAIRKPTEGPWGATDPLDLPGGHTWYSDAYTSPDGLRLRRIALTSNWSDDKHYSFARSWYSLGEVAIFGLPMQQATIILGQHRNGKRHGFWSHGLRHPLSKQLRFRKKNDKAVPFKSTWTEVWREDYDDIATGDWLSAMHSDGVLGDVAFNVDIPVPEKEARQKIVDLATRRLEEIWSAKEIPDQQLSTCDFPTPCIFRGNCHSGNQPSGKYGFVQIQLT